MLHLETRSDFISRHPGRRDVSPGQDVALGLLAAAEEKVKTSNSLFTIINALTDSSLTVWHQSASSTSCAPGSKESHNTPSSDDDSDRVKKCGFQRDYTGGAGRVSLPGHRVQGETFHPRDLERHRIDVCKFCPNCIYDEFATARDRAIHLGPCIGKPRVYPKTFPYFWK